MAYSSLPLQRGVADSLNRPNRLHGQPCLRQSGFIFLFRKAVKENSSYSATLDPCMAIRFHFENLLAEDSVHQQFQVVARHRVAVEVDGAGRF